MTIFQHLQPWRQQISFVSVEQFDVIWWSLQPKAHEVENIRMCLFHFIEENQAIWLSSHLESTKSPEIAWNSKHEQNHGISVSPISKFIQNIPKLSKVQGQSTGFPHHSPHSLEGFQLTWPRCAWVARFNFGSFWILLKQWKPTV